MNYDVPVLRSEVVQRDAAGQPCVVVERWMVLRRGRRAETEDGFIWQQDPDYWEPCDPPSGVIEDNRRKKAM